MPTVKLSGAPVVSWTLSSNGMSGVPRKARIVLSRVLGAPSLDWYCYGGQSKSMRPLVVRADRDGIVGPPPPSAPLRLPASLLVCLGVITVPCGPRAMPPATDDGLTLSYALGSRDATSRFTGGTSCA